MIAQFMKPFAWLAFGLALLGGTAGAQTPLPGGGGGSGGSGTVTSVACANGTITTTGNCYPLASGATTGDVVTVNGTSGQAQDSGTLLSSLTPPAAANPSGTIGLSAVNGSATTFMRSDAAPALSQAITPTWTGAHKFSAAGAASTPGLWVSGAHYSGGSGSTTLPQFLVQDSTATASSSWSATGTAIGVNAHTGLNNLMDLQLDGASELSVNANGSITDASGIAVGTTVSQNSGAAQPFLRGISGSVTMSVVGAAHWQLGALDASTVVGQTFGVQGATGSNTSGQPWAIVGSLPTGSGTPGSVLLQTGFQGVSATSAVTISNASPAVISWSSHGLSVNEALRFTTTGSLPSGLAINTTYYVISAGFGANSFEVSATLGGSAINTTTAGSGTQTALTATVQQGAVTAVQLNPGGAILMPNLPSADPHVVGELWSNSGVLTVSAG